MRTQAQRNLVGWFALIAALFVPWTLRAQQSSSTEQSPKSVQSSDYNIQQSIEFGYRDSIIDGNIDNYDTFENLGSGVRLFDYTLNMRSKNHNGLFFDNVTFSNFGYGGDPNDVTRLQIDKNKLYDFRAMFRRDKDFWDYNLLANPLNPASSVPALAIVNSPHSLDTVRRMQDYDLTLFPESRLRFRLGYSHNVNEGPGFTTLDGGTEPLLAEEYHYTTNAYRAGVDFRFLPKTTISFDELLTYFKQDNTVTDQNFPYVLSDGTPADLGIVFNTKGGTPCAVPIADATTTPPTATATCNGYLAYNRVGRPRGSFPTERLAFQSNYVKNLEMSGAIAYSSDEDSVPDFSEFMNSWTSRTGSRGATTGGPAKAKRISVDANWAGDYQITEKLHVVDEFRYANWRIPGMWATADTNLYPTPPAAPGQAGMLLPIAQATPANFSTACPAAPYNGPNCPQHSASAAADVVNELVSRFLAQNLKTNTVELEYAFAPRLRARLGYMYTSRTIADFNATFDTGEMYFPGGSTASATNDYLAARGDCALVAGVLPVGCTLDPTTGIVTEGSLTSPLPEAGNDTSRGITDIHENALLLGISANPTDKLRLSADFRFGYNDNSFTRISPRQVQVYKIQATYTPISWASIGGAIDIHENRDNVLTVNNLQHDRGFSLVTTLAPNPRVWADLGYDYTNFYTQADICFAEPGSTLFTTPCPVAGSPSPLGALSFYKSTDHFVYGDLMWMPVKRVTAMVGYSGSIVRGSTIFLNSLAPTGPLDFNYIKPNVSLAFEIYKDLTYKTAWNYYGYNDKGIANPAGLAALPLQDFNGNNVTFSLRYAF
jgi:hypothetical protein